jgi:hypothetical protein
MRLTHSEMANLPRICTALDIVGYDGGAAFPMPRKYPSLHPKQFLPADRRKNLSIG